MKHLLGILCGVFLAMFGNSCVAAPLGFEEAVVQADPVDFTLIDLQAAGSPNYVLADHQGPVLLDFYFNSCPACNNNADNVEAAAAAYHGDHAQVLQITIDCEVDEWSDWMTRHNVTTPVLDDCTRHLAESLGVHSYPTTIVLKPDRTIAYRYVGVWSQAAKLRIDQLMGAAD